MKILTISNTPWNTNNSFGNSYSNIFNGIGDIEFANIYCKGGIVNETKVKRSYQITEKSLIKNLLDKRKPSGSEVFDNSEVELSENEEKVYNAARKNRFRIYFFIRDLIWKIGRWKSPDLERFVDKFKPDLIFQPIYYSSYINELVLYCKKRTGVPMIGYISDDCYTIRQLKLSPFYWIERLYKRRKVKAAIEQCELLYVISQIQKEEYEKIFSPECKILTKCADFRGQVSIYSPNNILKLIYAGNLSKGRKKSLSLISRAVEKLSEEGYKIVLEIYSTSVLKSKDLSEFARLGCKFCGSVPYEKVLEKQKKADILIHVEGLSLKDRCEVHQSFSTKLVDYFTIGKCIFAVGTYDEASIKHLKDNNAAIIASDKSEVYEKLKYMLDNKEKLKVYANNAYLCGKNNHDKKKIQTMLIKDIKRVVDKA